MATKAGGGEACEARLLLSFHVETFRTKISRIFVLALWNFTDGGDSSQQTLFLFHLGTYLSFSLRSRSSELLCEFIPPRHPSAQLYFLPPARLIRSRIELQIEPHLHPA